MSWTFLTNHAHVLLCLATDPDLRLRDVAERAGITERAVQRIVHDLVEDDYLRVAKEGRRNHYEVNTDANLRHPAERSATIAELIRLVKRRQ